MLTFFLLLLFFENGFSANSVFIYQSPLTHTSTSITCTISGNDAAKFSPHLHCPMISSSLCFTNCSRECKLTKGECSIPTGLEAIYDCKYMYRSSDHIQIQYFINKDETSGNKGDWYCSYAGVNSPAINLTWPEYVSNQKREVTNPTVVRVTNKRFMSKVVPIERTKNDMDVITTTRATSKARESRQNRDSDEEISFRIFITKFQVVIGIICLFIISIILNITLCIRDSLVKYYIENLKNNSNSHKFLLFCLCQRNPVKIPSNDRSDRLLSRETSYSNADQNRCPNNIYESPFLPHIQQHNSYNEISVSPQIRRAQSFQHTMPTSDPIHFDQMSFQMPPGYSPCMYPPCAVGMFQNTPFGTIGRSSQTGSDTRREYVNKDRLYQVDSPAFSRLGSSNVYKNSQNMDLISDCGETNISQCVTDINAS